MSDTATTTTKRFQSDEGAVIAEFALVLPLLIVLLLGVFEYGFLFRQTNLFSGSVQAAARADTQAGATRGADQAALKSLAVQFQSLTNFQVSKVIVFKSTTADAVVPANCLTTATGINNVCNVYSGAQVSTTAAGGGNWGGTSSCDGSAWDRFWCPTARNASILGNPDWVGVYVEATYTSITKFFGGSTRTITDRAIYREEVTL